MNYDHYLEWRAKSEQYDEGYARGVQDGYALALKHIRNQVDRLEEYQNDRA